MDVSHMIYKFKWNSTNHLQVHISPEYPYMVIESDAYRRPLFANVIIHDIKSFDASNKSYTFMHAFTCTYSI